MRLGYEKGKAREGAKRGMKLRCEVKKGKERVGRNETSEFLSLGYDKETKKKGMRVEYGKWN